MRLLLLFRLSLLHRFCAKGESRRRRSACGRRRARWYSTERESWTTRWLFLISCCRRCRRSTESERRRWFWSLHWCILGRLGRSTKSERRSARGLFRSLRFRRRTKKGQQTRFPASLWLLSFSWLGRCSDSERKCRLFGSTRCRGSGDAERKSTRTRYGRCTTRRRNTKRKRWLVPGRRRSRERRRCRRLCRIFFFFNGCLNLLLMLLVLGQKFCAPQINRWLRSRRSFCLFLCHGRSNRRRRRRWRSLDG